MKSHALIVLFSLVSITCTDAGVDPPPLVVADDIREAVLRYMFADNIELQYGPMAEYFVSFCSIDTPSSMYRNYQDPSEEFINRFSGYPLPVKSGSGCSVSLSGVVDRVSGEKGMLFFVGDIMVQDHNHVKVLAGNPLELRVFLMSRSGFKWNVDRVGLIWIS